MSKKTYWMTGALVLALAGVGAAQASGDRGFGHGGHGGHGSLGADAQKLADTDGDGVVTVAEVQAKILQRAISIDANKDGNISVAEMDAHREQMRAERRANRLAKLDADNNGSISVEEYAAAKSERAAKRDRNGDGVIDSNDHGGRGDHRHGQKQ